MSAPIRAARARLRATPASKRQRLETTFTELNAANDALLVAASGLACALEQRMIEPCDVYALLHVIHARLKQTITDAKHATLSQDGAA